MLKTDEINNILKILTPKNELILNELKHELISCGLPELTPPQSILVKNAIIGALVTGMNTTTQELIIKGKLK